jgi:hypothetical protein
LKWVYLENSSKENIYLTLNSHSLQKSLEELFLGMISEILRVKEYDSVHVMIYGFDVHLM